VFKILGIATVISSVVTWACVSVFWGSVVSLFLLSWSDSVLLTAFACPLFQWKTESYTNRLKIFVLDYDTATSPLTSSHGSFIVNATLANFHSGIVDCVGESGHTTPKGTLGFIQVSITDYPTTQSVITAVLNERACGAVVINPQASAEIQSSRQNGNTSYLPTSAVTFVYAQARVTRLLGLISYPSYNLSPARHCHSGLLSLWSPTWERLD
jgi:hypothetical protein